MPHSGISDRLRSQVLSRPSTLLAWIMLAGTAMRLASAAMLGPDYNEAYFVGAARHFQLSYFDHPPLSIWLIWATMKLTGSDSLFILRMPFVLMFIGTTWLMYRLATELFDECVGAVAALLLNLSPVFTLGVGMALLPDSPLMPCLLAAILCVSRIAQGAPNRLALWAFAGVWFGLALLSKYSAVLVPPGLFVFALTSRAHRRWLFEPGPYLGCVIAVVVFSPVLIWNWQNHWASLGFQGGRALAIEHLDPSALVEAVLGQCAWTGPWLWVPLVCVYGSRLARGPRDAKSWYLCCAASVPILLFTLVTIWAPDTRSRYHWAAPGYLMLFPLLADFAVARLKLVDARTARWLVGSIVTTVLLLGVIETHAANGWLLRLTARFFPRAASLHDPLLQVLDWSELGPAVARRGLLDRPALFVVGTHRYQTGKLDVQLGKHLPVICLCMDPRNTGFQWDHRKFLGWDALIIGSNLEPETVQREYGPYFRKIEPIDTIAIHRGPQAVLTVSIYYGTGYYRLYPLPYPLEQARAQVFQPNGR